MGFSYFYPRPPRGGRRLESKGLLTKRQISIHALREEGDLHQATEDDDYPLFLSTPSARRATGPAVLADAGVRYFYPRPPRGGRPLRSWTSHPRRRISIHALREEGDRCPPLEQLFAVQFLSTPSARRATGDRFLLRHIAGISIHALREEGDCRWRSLSALKGYFYPRPPRGGRPTRSASS